MNEHALAALSAVAIWWLSTGVVLRLVWLPKSARRGILLVATALAALGTFGMLWASQIETVSAAYVGFASSIAVWAWHEVTFLMGSIAGPRREPAEANAVGWTRFKQATAAIIHHEVALAVTMLGLAAITWGAPNQVGTWTFLVLWLMRLSAKLNVFAGVRNLSEDFIPPHLAYLTSYFRRSRFGPLIGISIVAAVIVFVPLAGRAISAENSFDACGYTLVATMLGLAILEHAFLALPLPDAVLWRWILRVGPRPVSELCSGNEGSFNLEREARVQG